MDIILQLILKIFAEVFDKDRKARRHKEDQSKQKKKKKPVISFSDESSLNQWLKKQYEKHKKRQEEFKKYYESQFNLLNDQLPDYLAGEFVPSPDQQIATDQTQEKSIDLSAVKPSKSKELVDRGHNLRRINRHIRPTLKEMVVSQVILGPCKAKQNSTIRTSGII